jgi:hypothetical protein
MMSISKYRAYPQHNPTIELIKENLSNQITELNKTTLQISDTPSSGGVQLTLNGITQSPGISGDYTLTNKTIIFNNTDILIGDVILVSYIVAT